MGLLGDIGIGIAGLAGAFDPELPRRSLSGEVNETLGVQGDLFRHAAAYQPAYQALDQFGLQSMLFGGDPFRSLRWQRVPGQQIELRGGSPPPGFTQGSSNVPGVSVWNSRAQWRPVFDEQPPGYLQMYGDIFDTLGPMMRSVYEGAYPELTGGLEQALGAARNDFASGYNMTPAERRLLEQNVRASQAARGMGYGGADVAAESLAKTQAGMGLYQQRFGNLLNVLGQYASSMPNPFGVGQSIFNTARAGSGAAAQRLIDPFNSYSQDLFNTNFNAGAFEEIAAMNNRMAGAQSMSNAPNNAISTAGSFLGAFMGTGGG